MEIRVAQYLNQGSTLSSLSIYHSGHEICEANHAFGPAVRTHHLFHFILKGKGRYYVDNNCYHLHAGQGFLICPGKSTYYIADSNDPWEYIWVGFEGHDVNVILNDCGLSEQALIYTDNQSDLANQLLELINLSEQQYNRYLLTSQFYRIIACMQQPKLSPQLEQDHFDKAADFVYHNYGYDIKVSDIAKHVGIDRTYLYKVFIAKAQISPQQYLIHFRLKMACRLLESSKLNITEIAYSCGFKDMPAFYKHFKQNYKCTPVEYRKSPLYV